MSTNAFDPEILQDFLTESGELIEQLEGDLVVLERTPDDPALLNQVFRALHTIKGSASFLALANLVRVAHAAESALNAARNGLVRVDRRVMDLLLQAVDIVKTQLGQVRAGEPLRAAPDALVQTLSAIGEGRGAPEPVATPVQAPATPAPIAPGPARDASGMSVSPVSLPPGKAELLEFLVADVEETLSKIAHQVDELASASDVGAPAGPLGAQAESLLKTVEFFEFAPMCELARALMGVSSAIGACDADHLGQVLPRIQAVTCLLDEQAAGLKAGELRARPTAVLLERLHAAVANKALDPIALLPPGSTASAAMAVDGVKPEASGPAPSASPAAASGAIPIAAGPGPKAGAGETGDRAPRGAPGEDSHKKAAADATIRVEVSRLESLMNLVGELVLQKNRLAALTRRLPEAGAAADFTEQMTLSAGGLDRVTSDIQMAVMRTRMQPLDKLFGKYPRLLRDLSGKTGKKMRLAIEGGETEVDKSVIEELGDPLVHLIRNSADHGLEMPEERLASGKNEEGTITLRASHEGSHVRLLVIDDGRGLSRERIGAKAAERGLATPEAIAAMPDKDIWRFIFEAGFSTAEKVTDLSGRGVGMDVVRTNIQKIKGTIDITSELGKGTTISITIPLTVAILPAMMVGVGEEIYAIPLGNILEIVKPTPEQITTIGERPVMRLRETVLPLISGRDAFAQAEAKPAPTPFAVVLQQNESRIGLMVTRLIGQQEIVIKPLEGVVAQRGAAVSGATVRDDGGVSLIADVAELMNLSKSIVVKSA